MEDRLLISEQKIRELGKEFSKLPITPNTYTYINLYNTLQQFHFQGKYQIVIDICNLILESGY